MDSQALWLTLWLASTTTLALLAMSLPLAWWIANGRGAGRALVQAFVALPLVLPPTVIGFYLLVGLGPLTWAGRTLNLFLGHFLAFSFEGLLVGSMIYSLPFAVQPLVSGFQGVERGYLEAAQGLGTAPINTFFRLVLPLVRASVLASAVLTFTHTVGEFGVVLMLGGNIPGVTRTLSIALYDQVQDAQYRAANRTALTLVVLSLAGLLVVYLRPRPWGARRG